MDDNKFICDATTPPLSSIAPDFRHEGHEAAALLDAMMRAGDETRTPAIVRFAPTRIASRESEAPLAPAAKLVERALRFISANTDRPIRARDVAAHLNVSPSLLALRFRDLRTSTVQETILAERLARVQRLLRDTEASLDQIACDCGFSSGNRLSHLFKARYGCSPGSWRQRQTAVNAAL